MGQWAKQLLTKARERGLEKLAAAYAVAGWLLVQAASIALPAYQAPGWLLRWLIAATIMGFPAVLAVGWISNRERAATVARLGRLDLALLAAMGVIGVLTLGELAWHWSSQTGSNDAAAVSLPAQASIAVLPFANTSGDAGQRYFSEGLSDELIGLLARNSALRVAARTSSYFFEGKNEDIRTIAQKLNVRTVLEGSVRSANGRVRIEADLIDATDGYQLWSERYDRSLSDILLVQADIAGAIANALTPKLLGRTAATVPQAHAIDPTAYRLYLEGRFYMGQRTVENEQAALPLFRQVTSRAPDFAEGQAALAYDLHLLIIQGSKDPQLVAERDAALAKALNLDPNNPVALTLSILLALASRRWDLAIDDALTLKRTAPHNAEALHGLAAVYEEFGMSAQQLAAWQESVRLDPLSLNARMNLADTLSELSRNQEALESLRQALKVSPGNASVLNDMCGTLGLLKQIAAAKAILANLSLSARTPDALFDCRFAIAHGSGDLVQQRKLADEARSKYPDNGLDAESVGFYLALTHEIDPALDLLERGYADGSDIFNVPYIDSLYLPRALFQSPRWIALTKRPEFQLWSKARERALRELGGAEPV